MSLRISGVVMNNQGVASETLKLQFPLYPEAVRAALGDGNFLGTINIRLDQPLIIPVANYDLDTGASREQRIKWCDDWVAERFLFKRCELEIKSHVQSAWIYRASSTPNSVDPYLIEIMTEFVPNLKKSEPVVIAFERASYLQAVIALK